MDSKEMSLSQSILLMLLCVVMFLFAAWVETIEQASY